MRALDTSRNNTGIILADIGDAFGGAAIWRGNCESALFPLIQADGAVTLCWTFKYLIKRGRYLRRHYKRLTLTIFANNCRST